MDLAAEALLTQDRLGIVVPELTDCMLGRGVDIHAQIRSRQVAACVSS